MGTVKRRKLITNIRHRERISARYWRRAPVGGVPTATGGVVTTVAGFRYHTFNVGGTFTVSGGSLVCDFFVLGGGGGSGSASSNRSSGGGGGGGRVAAW